MAGFWRKCEANSGLDRKTKMSLFNFWKQPRKEGESRFKPASPFFIKDVSGEGYKLRFYKSTYSGGKITREIVELTVSEYEQLLS